MPEVSVVIPNYNYGDYLGQAVSSVLNQSFRDIEVLVIDNFSSDDSRVKVESLNDPRVEFHTFSNNGVIAASRNFGLKLAKGKFVAFLDADDFWFRTKLEYQLRFMSPGTFASYHDLWSIGRRPTRLVKGFSLGSKPLEEMCVKGNPVPLSSVLCVTSDLKELGGFPEQKELRGVEDFALWLSAASVNRSFSYINRPLGTYRIHNSMSSAIDVGLLTENLVRCYRPQLSRRAQKKSQGFVFYARALSTSQMSARRSYLWRTILSMNTKFAWRASLRLVAMFLNSKESLERRG